LSGHDRLDARDKLATVEGLGQQLVGAKNRVQELIPRGLSSRRVMYRIAKGFSIASPRASKRGDGSRHYLPLSEDRLAFERSTSCSFAVPPKDLALCRVIREVHHRPGLGPGLSPGQVQIRQRSSHCVVRRAASRNKPGQKLVA